MKSTKFKLTETGLGILVSNMTIGGYYFKHQADVHGEDERIGDAMVDLAKALVETHYRHGEFRVTHDDHLLMLLSVRSALAAFIENNSRDVQKFLTKYDPVIGSAASTASSKKAIGSTHLLLDYLECHAPKRVFKYWMDDRRKTTTTMFQDLLEHWEED